MRLICVIEWIKAVLRYFGWKKKISKWTFSKKQEIAFSLKATVCEDMIFKWLSPVLKQLLEKLHSEFLHALNFPCTWNKEAISCRKNIVPLLHNFVYMANSFAISLDITVMINILQEIIWFHNDALEKNSLLNGHFQRTSNIWIKVRHTFCQKKTSL